jgi:hypothetical protein
MLDENLIDTAEEILSEYLSYNEENINGTEYTREQFDHFVRTSAWILNQKQIITQDISLADIENTLSAINADLLEAIKNLSTVDDFVFNIKINKFYFIQYLRNLPNSTIIEKYSINTLKWIVNFVVFNITKFDINEVITIINSYKRYYLPIYTSFYYEILDAYVIKNKLMKLYYDDRIKIEVEAIYKKQYAMHDRMSSNIYLNTDDFNEVIDSAHTSVNPLMRENISTDELVKIFLEFIIGSDKYIIDDKSNPQTIQTRRDTNEVIDSVTITIN